MNKTQIFGSLSLATIFLLSSGKNENSQNSYNEQLKDLASRATIYGDTLTAEALEGKMVLVNFWASYDAQSRINSYQLVGLQEAYQNKEFFGAEGLEVVSISLDKYCSPMKKAINVDGTENFHHLCDFQGTDSEMARAFDVNRPVNLLLDAQGRIVARDFGTENVRQTLEMLCQSQTDSEIN